MTQEQKASRARPGTGGADPAGGGRPRLSVVCPVRDEMETVIPFLAAVRPVLEALTPDWEVVFVDDGSNDATVATLLEARRSEPRLRLVELARNFGKEAALTAGIEHARGEAVIPMDVDLQDPPELIPDMVRLWQEGFDVVLAQRVDRSSDSWFKRQSAGWFYRLHNRIAETPIPPDVGDFRLMDRRVVDALARLPERRRFMKGLFAWVGFRQAILPYERRPRVAGRSKFSGWRLWNFALEGITSFSTVPLRVWTYLGLLVALVSFLYGSFIIGRVLFLGRDLPGYASLITVVLFLGGMQLIGLGVLGEYLGRIYSEAKGRPVYVVRAVHEDHES